MKCLLISLADFHLLGQVCPLRFRWSSLASPLVLRSSRLSERARVASREDNTLDKYYNDQSLPPRWCVPVQHRNNSGVELCGSAPLAKAHPFSSATFNSTRHTDKQTKTTIADGGNMQWHGTALDSSTLVYSSSSGRAGNSPHSSPL